MPAIGSHFDVAGLCAQVHEQDLGLLVSTNNPGGFRRLMYLHFKQQPSHTLHIYNDKTSPNRFLLLKAPITQPTAQDTLT